MMGLEPRMDADVRRWFLGGNRVVFFGPRMALIFTNGLGDIGRRI